MEWILFHSRRVRSLAFWLGQTCGWLVVAAAMQPRAEGSAPEAAPRYGPPSNWVKPQFFNLQAAPQPAANADDQWLLLEQQINAQQNETFRHSLQRILTLAGVQKDATLTLDFNPGCQSVALHWARVWRGGEHLDRLDPKAVKIVQQERNLDQYILDGRKSIVLVMDDVRVGDVIDYAYSIQGTNPVFNGHFSAIAPVQMVQPAERLLTRVLWPKGRQLYAKPHGCTVQPVVVAGKEFTEYDWDMRQVPGVALEDAIPAWCDPEAWVQLSEFKTWAEVNQWAAALFQASAPFAPGLSQKVEEWKSLASREEQVQAALRFVQDEVRYFGIEIGVSTQKPADPSTVFTRRFGDCKDKSLLFVSILRALGVEAYPVLVNATYGRGIADWQPTAGAFDHCIAAVRLDDQTYWLDPTMNYQRGPLGAHYLPRYGCGLVIAPQTTGLTPIPQATGLPRTTTVEYFRVRGKEEAAELKVVTVAEGRDAEALRQLFAETKRADIEKNYTHAYADLYPGIKMVSPIAIADDESLNRVQTTEFYSIEKAWGQPEKNHKSHLDFYPSAIAARLRKPVDTARRFPFGIDYPEHQNVRIEATLPGAWPAGTEKLTVQDSAFLFQKAHRCTGNKLVMEFDYQALADGVMPGQTAEYVQHVNQSLQSLGYSLSWR